jgi:TonB family protein
MKSLLTFPFLLVASFCLAQRQNVYFIKNNGARVPMRDSADFIRTVTEPDSGSSLYDVVEIFSNGNKKLIGKSISADPPKFDGVKLTFFKNGAKESITNYKNGSKAGDEMDYFPNGKLYIQKSYPDNGKADNSFRDDFTIVLLNDSTGKTLITNGNGHYQAYNKDFSYIKEEGEVKDGKMTGTWKGNFKEDHITFTENYDNGVLISGTSVNKDGKKTTYTKSRMQMPEFEGGVQAFSQYLGSNIRYPALARKNGIEGRVILSFSVEKDGGITDITVVRSLSPDLDEEALRVLKKSPNWRPGTWFGIPVKVKYVVPIVFKLKS